MTILRKLMRFFVPFIYASLMLYGVARGLTNPNYKWDMLGYVGTVYAWQEKTPEAIYARTMADIKESIPDWVYVQHAQNPLSAEPNAFHQQLPFYEIKPLYPASLWLLHFSGLTLSYASWIASTLCMAALAVLLFRWRTRYLPHDVWLLLALGLGFFWEWPLMSLAPLSTPDAMCTLLSTAALFAWLFRRSFLLFCLLGWLATLARPDALIFMGAMSAYFAVLAPREMRQPFFRVIGFCLVLLLTNTIVNRLAGAYSYEHLFIYGYIDRTPHPADITQHLTFAQYRDVLLPAIPLFLGYARNITFIVLSLLACFCHFMQPEPGNRVHLGLLLISWSCVVVRFLLWPAWGEERYYYGYYIVILLAVGELMAPYIKVLLRMLAAHRKAIQNSNF